MTDAPVCAAASICGGSDALRHENGGRFLQALHLARGVEPAFGRNFLAPLGYEAAIRRADHASDVDHLIGHRHLEIHASLQQILRDTYVLHLDVAAILPQMQGDVVRAGHLRGKRGVHRIGIPATTRLAQRRDVIDIHSQGDRFKSHV
jgi:hypothetical protein